MPGLLPLTGLYGKVPAHGDFVRRGLPSSFVTPWDDWLQAGMSRTREGLGERWAEAWDAAPAWRFALPAGICGPDAVAGVMLPSMDTVGRRFPITLATMLPPGAPPPEAAWFDALEGAALAGRGGAADADALAAAIPDPARPLPLVAAFPLPVLAAAFAPEAPAAALSWPQAAVAPAAPPAEDADVLALLSDAGGPEGPAAEAGAEAAEGTDDMAPPADPDAALALLIGAAPPAPLMIPDPPGAEAPSPAPEDAVLALLGRKPGGPPPEMAPMADAADLLAGFAAGPRTLSDGADLLAGFAAAPAARSAETPPSSATPGAIPEGEDFLAGFAAAARPEAGPVPLTAIPTEEEDFLAGIAAAPTAAGPPPALPGLGPETELPGGGDLPGGLAADRRSVPPGPIPEGEDILAGFIEDSEFLSPAGGPAPDAFPGHAEEPSAVAAPPAPEGGGWWTRGAAHVPPMVWALPALPSPADFAYLLEAEA